MSILEEPFAQSVVFAEFLVETGLVCDEDLLRARGTAMTGDAHIDEILIALGLVDAKRLAEAMSRAWKLARVDLASEWVDDDLVRQWAGEMYLAENWMPVRDRANGSVLVATARRPDAERAARVAAVIESPVEFAVATSGDIRSAVLAAFGKSPRTLSVRLLRAVGRPRD